MDKEIFLELVDKVTSGSATDQELSLYSHCIAELRKSGEMQAGGLPENDDWNEPLMDNEDRIKAELYQRINREINRPGNIDEQVQSGESGNKTLWYKITAAAVVLIILSAGLVSYYQKNKAKDGSQFSFRNHKQGHDFLAGGSKGTLILANGKTIDLQKAPIGEIASYMGVKISKTAQGELTYDDTQARNSVSFSKAILNTINTPKGGEYRVVLADGTKVWINAMSSLRYPSTFAGLTERKIGLSGEAYFEVAKVRGMPFMVLTDRQEMEVLGTHFNVNSYPDDTEAVTTLLEGLLRVSLLGKSSERLDSTSARDVSGHSGSREAAGLILKPGQKAVLHGGSLEVFPADLKVDLAWQRGYFTFDEEHITSIMRRLSRWYNAEIIFPDKMPADMNFSGSISKYKNMSTILHIIELTGEINFEIRAGKVYVWKTY